MLLVIPADRLISDRGKVFFSLLLLIKLKRECLDAEPQNSKTW